MAGHDRHTGAFSRAIPTNRHAHSQRYGDHTLPELCAEMHLELNQRRPAELLDEGFSVLTRTATRSCA
ncbi:MAG: hypothetical protein EDR02_05905 [Actinobacteria bacterium]|nr:MAG: hypothetical protein EDR02_05905 [Actinomycetota bacterium]RIK08174.1 MAG: hypothetical protein DCC48_02025 [Acidobacteriota bacterium]